MIYKNTLILLCVFCLQTSHAQTSYEIEIDSSSFLTDPITNLGRALKIVATEDRLIFFDFENYRILFYTKGDSFADSQIRKVIGEHSRVQANIPYDQDLYNRLSQEYSGTLFNNQLWVTNYSFGEILVFDRDGNHIITYPGRYRVFDTSDTSLYALDFTSMYRWDATADTFAYLKEIPGAVRVTRDDFGANVKLGANRLGVYDQDTLKVYSLIEYINGQNTDTIFTVISAPLPEFEIMPNKILWATDYSGNYLYSDLNGNNRGQGIFNQSPNYWHFNPDNRLYTVSTSSMKIFDVDLNQIAGTFRDLYYWQGRFLGADTDNLYFYDFTDGGFAFTPLNALEGTYLVNRNNEIGLEGANDDLRIHESGAYLLTENPPDSMKIIHFVWQEKDSSMFKVDSVYGFEISNDSIFTLAGTIVKIYGLDGALLDIRPLTGYQSTTLDSINRYSYVFFTVNQHNMFVVYNDTLHVFNKNGVFSKSLPYNIQSNNYYNIQLFADETYVYSNWNLWAINIDTGEMSPYAEGASGGGFIYGDQYIYQAGQNIYMYQTINVLSNIGRQNTLVTDFALLGSYPNPFNPETTIEYRLARVGLVELSVYNILGQKIAELVNSRQSAGLHKVVWNSAGMSSGIYFYELKMDERRQILRGILIK